MKPGERGTALLSVLLLVAVMAAISATAMDRLGLATRLAGNAASAAQARQWLAMAEDLAVSQLEGQAADAGAALNSVLGVERTIALPDGMAVQATLRDGGNCFNLNSLVEERDGGRLIRSRRSIDQFTNLLVLLGLGTGEARRIAESSADYIDTDRLPSPFGNERALDSDGVGAVPDRAMVSVTELSRIDGVDADTYRLLQPWVCALPDHDLTGLNVETLQPEQAPLIAMLAPEQISIGQAHAHLAGRPASGYGSVYNFWNDGLLGGVNVSRQATEQLRVDTRFFTLDTAVDTGDLMVRQRALIAIEDGHARRVWRRWGDGA
ncbi:type II secretion system minor pseudopilin GspK [Sphingomicrobium marinum]|uniref:type II secretion system minor pseudopilin GspK n=1 Tax=Sphingomicrobium marinum TaxID=1227950 RepID=UPI0022407C39|nr:type II secretion system minor pseudopilin GspK [Sphingomicrobium marinum]